MNAQDMLRYLQLLGEELQRRSVTGEIVLVGGAVMLLVIGSRRTTRDIDAYFGGDAGAIREAARAVAEQERLPPDWINEGVKGYFYSQPPQTRWVEHPGLRVFVANPDYVLAMKAVAGRPQDIQDILDLASYLNLSRAEDVLALVVKYVPQQVLTPRTQYLIESLFPA